LAPLLGELREHYRLVLIEAASLRHAETAPLAAACDGAYLVVRPGWDTRRGLGQAAAAIRQCQGRLLGCIAVG
jgi:Mrp family chromosome partitioning ATPase